MALTEDAVETMEYIRDRVAQDAGVLSAWEKSFIQDQLDRYSQYGEQTRFSEKQWAVIEKIEKVLVNDLPSRAAK